MGDFRFQIGDEVRVVTHPGAPRGTIVARWAGTELGDPYGENVYQLSSFVTKQRESSLELYRSPSDRLASEGSVPACDPRTSICRIASASRSDSRALPSKISAEAVSPRCL